MKIDKLRRLVRVTQLLYRQEAAAVARLQSERADLLRAMEGAMQQLDAEEISAFDASLAIAWAARRRRDLTGADTRLASQLSAAGSALATVKGAESRLSNEHDKLEKEAELRALEQVIENVVSRGSRFGQADKASVGDGPEMLALPPPRGDA